MANCLIMLRDLAAAGTFSAENAVVTLPAANAGTASLAQVTRSIADTSWWIQVDTGSSQAMGIVAVLACNLTSSATFRVRTSNNSDMSSPDIDSGVISVSGYLNTDKRQLVYPFSATSTRRYVRVDLIDASLSYIEVGKLVCGPVAQPTRNYAFGWQWSYEDPSEASQSIGGQRWMSEREGFDVLNVELPFLTNSEGRGDFATLIRRMGRSQPFLFCLDPASSDRGRDTIWGTAEEAASVRFTHPDLAATAYRIKAWR